MEGISFLSRLVEKSLAEKVMFEQRLGGGGRAPWGSAEALRLGAYLVCSRHSKEAPGQGWEVLGCPQRAKGSCGADGRSPM